MQALFRSFENVETVALSDGTVCRVDGNESAALRVRLADLLARLDVVEQAAQDAAAATATPSDETRLLEPCTCC